MTWSPITYRIICAIFRTNIRNINISQWYPPTCSVVKEEFYGRQKSSLQQVCKGDIIIVMGDLITKVGHENTNLENVMGRHGMGIIIKRGPYTIKQIVKPWSDN